MPVASVNGMDLNYLLEGDGDEVVVLLNGLADTLEDWELQVEGLIAAGYRTLRHNCRGVGPLDAWLVPDTTRGLAENLGALLAELEIDSAHLVGFSLGGLVAQEAVLSGTVAARSLTLASTFASPGPYCGRLLSFWQDLACSMGVEAVLRDAMLSAFTPEYFHGADRLLDEVEDVVAQETDLGLESFLSLLEAMRSHDTASRLREIDVPTLVLAAEQDAQVPALLTKELHHGIANSRWVLSPGGHAAAMEEHAAINAAIVGFLASVSASA